VPLPPADAPQISLDTGVQTVPDPESVDKRIGGMAVKEAAQIQWGDAEAAMDYWAQKITERAVALGAGTPAAASQSSASK
jgi:hypothetical protein